MMNKLISIYDAITAAEITLPFSDVAIVLILLSVFYFLKTYRLGLLISFLFVFRLGWIFVTDYLSSSDYVVYIVAYAVFGF